MKKLSFATLLFAAFAASPVDAADMAVKSAPIVAARPPCAQFGGFYVGGNVGYAYYGHNFHDRDALGPFIDTGLSGLYRDTENGWNGGVQGGYNYQSGCTLFGVEADWNWSDVRASSFNQDGDQFAGGPPTDSVTLSSRMRWFGTVRARSGVIVDNVLLYATGGLAYANFDRSFRFFEDGPVTTGVFNSSQTKWGWTAGLGTEWAFAPNWSLKTEALYMQFEKNTVTVIGNGVIGALAVPYRLESQDHAFVSRIGVNYRFGGGAVVAKY
jgi:outer membrane immunogenic protein